ncbi:MAG TPA: F0F1 ATP synthase subunit delta [Candidatus Dormibacteraeota bacterium]|nr:F0F1 ATP synthase subunit delta [Candidatus Dormibacteraeota bacterium]
MPEPPRIPSNAQHYATALIDLARQEGGYEPWQARLARLQAVLGDPDLLALLHNPSLTTAQKVELTTQVLGADPAIDLQARNLALVLVSGHRQALLPAVAAAYGQRVDAAEGRVRARLTTAITLPEPELDRLAATVSQHLGRRVLFDATVDPRIIGGMILRIGDRIFDGSLATRLSQLRQTLITQPITG